MNETLQRYTVHKLYGGSISAEPDGNYVLYDDAQRRIEMLEGALREARDFIENQQLPDSEWSRVLDVVVAVLRK